VESEAGRLVRARTSSGLSNEQLSIAVRREVEEAGERELGTNSAAPTPRPQKESGWRCHHSMGLQETG